MESHSGKELELRLNSNSKLSAAETIPPPTTGVRSRESSEGSSGIGSFHTYRSDHGLLLVSSGESSLEESISSNNSDFSRSFDEDETCAECKQTLLSSVNKNVNVKGDEQFYWDDDDADEEMKRIRFATRFSQYDANIDF
jgi:hypothetical protein